MACPRRPPIRGPCLSSITSTSTITRSTPARSMPSPCTPRMHRMIWIPAAPSPRRCFGPGACCQRALGNDRYDQLVIPDTSRGSLIAGRCPEEKPPRAPPPAPCRRRRRRPGCRSRSRLGAAGTSSRGSGRSAVEGVQQRGQHQPAGSGGRARPARHRHRRQRGRQRTVGEEVPRVQVVNRRLHGPPVICTPSELVETRYAREADRSDHR